jgi:hypothetical protein
VFSTKPGFEDPTAKLLGDPDHAYWLAVELTTRQPWYLLNYKVATTDGSWSQQTVAIAWESTLACAIAGLKVDALQGLFVVRMADSSRAHWTMQEVQALWAPAQREEHETGPLLFSFKGDSRVYNSHFDIIETVVDDRRCVHKFATLS